jgi:hypothetical protein
MLNGLCSAGTKLALSLQALLSVHDTMAQCRVTSQCLAGWEELTRATNVASHTVKKHVIAAMKDYEILDNDGEKHVGAISIPTYSGRLHVRGGQSRGQCS